MIHCYVSLPDIGFLMAFFALPGTMPFAWFTTTALATHPCPSVLDLFFSWDAYASDLWMWVFPKIMVSPNHPFYWVFHYKSSILGYPYFWKHPCPAKVSGSILIGNQLITCKKIG